MIIFTQKRLAITDEQLSQRMGGGGSSTSGDASASAAEAEPVKEKESFDIKIGAVDQKIKIKVIKEVRGITGLGLKEVSLLYHLTM